jgi:hypothetical protein
MKGNEILVNINSKSISNTPPYAGPQKSKLSSLLHIHFPSRLQLSLELMYCSLMFLYCIDSTIFLYNESKLNGTLANVNSK